MEETGKKKSNENESVQARLQSVSSPVVQSTDLLQGQREILIEHNGQYYRLRLTKADKLILHK